MSQPKLITFRFSRFIELSLGSLDFIEVPFEEAVLIQEVDKENSLTHVEFPTDDNLISKPQVWSISAWRKSLAKHEKAKKESAQNRIEYENYKTNIHNICMVLSKTLGRPSVELQDIAVAILKKNPDNLTAIGIELVKPYYKGVYVILPCRKME